MCADVCANLTIKKRSALCRTSFISCTLFSDRALAVIVVFRLHFGFILVSYVFRGLSHSCALWTRIILA